MKKQKKIEKELTLLERLEKHMHNWWWLGIEFDWKMNPKKGKVWVFKDCTGINMKAVELLTIELWVVEHYK